MLAAEAAGAEAAGASFCAGAQAASLDGPGDGRAAEQLDRRGAGRVTVHVVVTAMSGGRVLLLAEDRTAALRLDEVRRDFVANVSHELRTPIASIRSLAEALNDGLVKKEDDRTRYYGYILRESMRLSRLINDLLELSRIQSGSPFISEICATISRERPRWALKA